MDINGVQDTGEKPLLAEERGAPSGHHITSKSLWLCLVVPNPSHPSVQKKDEELLEKVEKQANSPKFKGLLKRDSVKPDEENPSIARMTAAERLDEEDRMKLLDEDTPIREKVGILLERRLNRDFGGHRLDILDDEMSPDKDEIYVKIHADEALLKWFAEQNAIILRTSETGRIGGAPEPYSSLRDSEIGFDFPPPQKQRTLIKCIKTPTAFDGCGIPIDELRKSGLVLGFFPLHNAGLEKYKLKDWASLTALFRAQPHREISRYFGEKVGLYFYWMDLYTKALALPSIIGLGAGAFSLITGNDQHAGLAGFSCFIVAWAMGWDVHWTRAEREWAHKLGADIESEQEVLRDGYRGEPRVVDFSRQDGKGFQYPLRVFKKDDENLEIYYPSWKRMLALFAVSVPIIIFLIAALVISIFFINKYRFKCEDDGPLPKDIVASVLTVVVMVVFNIVYDKIARGLNWLENYRTDSEYENALIRKSFLYYFCNAYSALFIIAFWPDPNCDGVQKCSEPDDPKCEHPALPALRSQMLIILVVKPMIQNFLELVLPWAKTKLKRYMDQRGADPETRTELTPAATEASLEPYETPLSDYQEIALQFGYMAMFACVFPWGPLVSMAYNLLEIRVDANKIVYHCQRPKAHVTTNIGAWSTVFKFLAVMSVMTNAYLICWLSNTFQHAPYNVPNTNFSRAMTFIVSQYSLFFIVVLIFWGCPGTPINTLKNQAKQQYLAQEERTRVLQLNRLQSQQQQATQRLQSEF